MVAMIKSKHTVEKKINVQQEMREAASTFTPRIKQLYGAQQVYPTI